MNTIKEYSISLMLKESKVDDKKDSFIIKNSAKLDVEKAYETVDMDFVDFILESCELIFNELMEHNKNKIDSVGVWFRLDDGQVIDNAISLSILEDIKNYGSEDVNPFKEFIKMTLNIVE